MTKKKVEKKPVTHVAIVLDESGSMSGTKSATITGCNEQIQQLKKNAKEGHDIRVSLVTFNGDVFEHNWEVPVEELNEIPENEYHPDGSTALFDGACYAIEKLKETTDANEEGASYLILIITDGWENASKNRSQTDYSRLRAACEETKKWTFTLLGCDKKKLEEFARTTGTPVNNMGLWSNKTSRGATGSLQRSVKNYDGYFTSKLGGAIQCSNFYNADNEVADFTEEENDLDNAPVDLNLVDLRTPVVNPADSVNINPMKFTTPLPSQSWSVTPNVLDAGYFKNKKPVTWKS